MARHPEHLPADKPERATPRLGEEATPPIAPGGEETPPPETPAVAVKVGDIVFFNQGYYAAAVVVFVSAEHQVSLTVFPKEGGIQFEAHVVYGPAELQWQTAADVAVAEKKEEEIEERKKKAEEKAKKEEEKAKKEEE